MQIRRRSALLERLARFFTDFRTDLPINTFSDQAV